MDNNFAVTRQPILLTPEGQQLFDVLESYINSELPPYTNSKMNEMVNNLAAAGEFVPTVRSSVVDLFFREGITDEQRGLTTTIVDKEEWPKEEKRYETALRLFPSILSEQVDGYYPIQWLSMQEADGNYNLQNVSLIPLVIKVGIELQQLDEELRGGLLSSFPGETWNTLQQIICYSTENNEDNKLLDDCFPAVRNWMKENTYLVNGDIQRYNLVGEMCICDKKLCHLEDRIQYLINMDPVTLSLPCQPENSDWLPIHWSTENEDIRLFSSLLKAGMKYYPDKFGFVFGEVTHRNNRGALFKGTPFRRACTKYGQEIVKNEVINCIREYCSSSASASTSISAANNKMETSLFMSATTDETIHLDCLYILLRKDPEAAFLMLRQKLSLLVGDGQTVTDTDTNSNSNNKNTNGASNNNATSCAFNSTSSSISTTNTIAAAVSSSTNTNNNNNNNDDTHNNRDIEIAAQHQPSSSLSKLKGKKRKHEMV